MMKLIYEESPRRFSDLLDSLTAGQGNLLVGPIFEQQRKQQNSIPDLLIHQHAFTIAFETKLTDWFYSDQLNSHLAGLAQNRGTLILFLLSNFESDATTTFKAEVEAARANNILLIPISYEDLLKSLEEVCSTLYLTDILDEFRGYLDSNQLLPRWKYLLDVVNCVGTMHEIQAGAYICPDTKGAYSHRRARFLGPYANKAVRRIYEVDAVVSLSPDQEYMQVKWNNQVTLADKVLFERAKTLIEQLRPVQSKEIPLQVFLLGNSAETLFEKRTPGGMLSSKTYFWNVGVGQQTIDELATYLTNKSWQEVQ